MKITSSDAIQEGDFAGAIHFRGCGNSRLPSAALRSRFLTSLDSSDLFGLGELVQ